MKKYNATNEEETLNKLVKLEEKLYLLQEFSKQYKQFKMARRNLLDKFESSKNKIERTESRRDTKQVTFAEQDRNNLDAKRLQTISCVPPYSSAKKAQKSTSLYDLLSNLHIWHEEISNRKSAIELLKLRRHSSIDGTTDNYDGMILKLEKEKDELDEKILLFILRNINENKEDYKNLIRHLEDENKEMEDRMISLHRQVEFLKETNIALMRENQHLKTLHLTSPYTCLTWISSTNFSHQKKKRKSDGEGRSPMVVLGMQSGGIVVYSIAEGGLVSTLNDGHKSSVLCLAWQRHADLFTCTAENFVHWDVKNKSVRRKWKNGQTCTAMAVSEDGEILVTASNGIKWWNVVDKTVVKTFTGHATSIVHLAFLTSASGDNYVVSAAQNDRLLNTWCLNTTSDNHAVASFLMSDIAQSVSVNVSQDGSANLVVVTQSGTLHLYSQQLNGKRGKPLKPKLTIMIASDTGQSKAKVSPLNIVAAHLLANLRAHIVYGQPPFLAFETIEMEHTSKELCLVRKDPKATLTNNQESVTKVRQPEVSKDVQYMSSASTMVNGSSVGKRGRSKESEVPMEERLENLALNQPSASTTQPKGEGMAHLLLQGLQSKDKSLLQSVLFKRDESVIAQTVQRLPVQVINPLVKELTSLMQGKTFTTQVAVLWLKALLAAHASQLLADPGTTATLTPLLSLVEARLGCLAPLARLRGRLDLMLHQMSGAETTTSLDSQALVVHQDQDSTEEGSDTFGSDAEDDESEDKWDELSDDEVENMESEDVELSS